MIVTPTFATGYVFTQLLTSCGNLTMSNQQTTGNASANGTATLSGSAVLNGNLTAAKVNITGGAKVTGTVTQSPGAVNCFPIDLSPVKQLLTLNNSNANIPAQYLNNGALTVSGSNSLTLPAGNYFLNSITVSGSGQLLTSGQVNIFVTQSLTASGNTMAGQNGPQNLVIFSDSTGSMTLSGNTTFAGMIYAPNGSFTASGQSKSTGDFFAGQVTLTGGATVSQQ